MTMIKKLSIAVLSAFLLTTGVAQAADDITRCGSKQFKAFASYAKPFILLSAKACKKGQGGVAPTIDAVKVTKVTEKLKAKMRKAVAKHGEANCAFKTASIDAISVADGLDQAQNNANAFCKVP